MTVEERLAKIERRQEAMISALHDMVASIETNQAMLGELMKWLQEPPPSELPDLLRMLIGAARHQATRLDAIERLLSELPVAVARAVSDGEID
jgi:hypothetical protein